MNFMIVLKDMAINEIMESIGDKIDIGTKHL